MPQMMRLGSEFRIFLRTENDLRQPFTIAQIDKDHSAVVAPDMDPASERGVCADVSLAKLSAMMRSIHGRGRDLR
jgi:hypothetical protein